MSKLAAFGEKPFENEEVLLKTLEELTKECQIQENREALDRNNFIDLSSILKSYLNENQEESEMGLKILTESCRFIRNSCVNCKTNQDCIRERTEIISGLMKFLKSSVQNEERHAEYSEERIVAIRCCLQSLTNFMVDNVENCVLVSPHVNESLCALIKSAEDEKIIQYAAMGLHLLLKLNPEWIKLMDTSFLKSLFQTTHLEFVMYVIETLAENDLFIGVKFSESETEQRVTFLKIVIAHTELHHRLPQPVLKLFAEHFKSKSDLIFKSQIQSDEWVCWEVASLLELLCCVTTTDATLSSDTSLLTTGVFLLRSVHAAGKIPSEEGNDNDFSPVQNLSSMRINAESEEMRSQPTFQFKAHLIRLIANLVHRNFQNQELVREAEGLPIILDCCQIDARNPFITQWAVLAIRNLCEGNPENQEFIKQVQRVDTENTLPKLHLIGM